MGYLEEREGKQRELRSPILSPTLLSDICQKNSDLGWLPTQPLHRFPAPKRVDVLFFFFQTIALLDTAEFVRQLTYSCTVIVPPHLKSPRRGERKLWLEHLIFGGTNDTPFQQATTKILDCSLFLFSPYFSGMFQQATPTSFPLLQKVPRLSSFGLSEVLLFRATIKFYLLKHDGLEKKTTHQEPEKPAFISMTTAWTLLPT